MGFRGGEVSFWSGKPRFRKEFPLEMKSLRRPDLSVELLEVLRFSSWAVAEDQLPGRVVGMEVDVVCSCLILSPKLDTSGIMMFYGW